MQLDKSKVHNILLVTLSNLGDIVLTFPVLDALLEQFPQARLSVVVGEKGNELLAGNPLVARVFVYRKRTSLGEKFSWFRELASERFDLIVDLRNTALPFFLFPQWRTSFSEQKIVGEHRREKHWRRLTQVLGDVPTVTHRRALYVTAEDKQAVAQKLKPLILSGEIYAVVAPGAANEFKRWWPEGFAEVIQYLMLEKKMPVVLVGDHNDREVVQRVLGKYPSDRLLNLAGQTNLRQLAEVLHRSRLLVANDSGIMHLASYLDVPVLALFGPTDEKKYGPWSARSIVVRKQIFCAPCEKSGCAFHHECMMQISASEVIAKLETMLTAP